MFSGGTMRVLRPFIAGIPFLVFATATWGQGSIMSDAVRHVANEHRGPLLAVAEAMPASRYSFRPTPAQMTFGTLILHIRDDNRITWGAIAGRDADVEERLVASDPKEKLVTALRRSLDFCDSALAHVSDSQLSDSVSYYGHPAMRVQALVGLVDDWADHYGQAAIYLRLNRIAPPTAKQGAT